MQEIRIWAANTFSRHPSTVCKRDAYEAYKRFFTSLYPDHIPLSDCVFGKAVMIHMFRTATVKRVKRNGDERKAVYHYADISFVGGERMRCWLLGLSDHWDMSVVYMQSVLKDLIYHRSNLFIGVESFPIYPPNPSSSSLLSSSSSSSSSPSPSQSSSLPSSYLFHSSSLEPFHLASSSSPTFSSHSSYFSSSPSMGKNKLILISQHFQRDQDSDSGEERLSCKPHLTFAEGYETLEQDTLAPSGTTFVKENEASMENHRTPFQASSPPSFLFSGTWINENRHHERERGGEMGEEDLDMEDSDIRIVDPFSYSYMHNLMLLCDSFQNGLVNT